MNLDELRPILTGYRAQVQAAWSPATAHPDFEGKAGDPAGQCGVTSAWLQRRLAEDHGVETVYCVGYLATPSMWKSSNHCWLETADEVVVDLTADQYSGLPPVTCETYGHLDGFAGWAWYFRRGSLTPEQLAADPVQPRLALLEAAMS